MSVSVLHLPLAKDNFCKQNLSKRRRYTCVHAAEVNEPMTSWFCTKSFRGFSSRASQPLADLRKQVPRSLHRGADGRILEGSFLMELNRSLRAQKLSSLINELSVCVRCTGVQTQIYFFLLTLLVSLRIYRIIPNNHTRL